jgi:DNA polymerase III delta subunit
MVRGMVKSSAYLIYGDEFFCEARAKEIINQLLTSEEQVMGLEAIDGMAENVDAAVTSVARCLESLRAMSIFSAKKVTFFKNVNFTSETQTGKSETVKNKLAELTASIKAGIPAGQALVMTAGKVDKRQAFYKACQASCELIEFEVSEKPAQASKQACDILAGLLEESGLRMNRDVCEEFVNRVGYNSRQLSCEVQKLALYMDKPGEVTRETVREITSATRDAVAWDLTDAIGARDLTKAISILRHLLFQKENAVGIVIMIESRFRDLMLYRDGLDRRWIHSNGNAASWRIPPEAEVVFKEQLSKDPRSVHSYRIGVLAGQAQNYKPHELKAALSAAIEAHRILVSSSISEAIVLELLLVRIMTRTPVKSTPDKR